MFLLTYIYFFQTVFADQPQVAYIQQDGTTQQVSASHTVTSLSSTVPSQNKRKATESHLQVTVLLPGGQNMNAANLHVLSNVEEAPQAILEPVSQVRTLLTCCYFTILADFISLDSKAPKLVCTEDGN